MSSRGRIQAVFRMVRKHVVKVKQRMEKGFTPLMKPLPMIVLAAVIGLFLFSLSSGVIFDMLREILALFGATAGELAMAKTSTEALAFATSCTAFDGPGDTSISVWEGEGEHERKIRERTVPADCPDDGVTFGTTTAGIGGITGMITGQQPVTVYCPGPDGDNPERCYVNSYFLPQPNPPRSDCDILDPSCWHEWWLPGYGDPNIAVYHEKFPQEAEGAFTMTGWDTILLTAGFVGVMSLALDATVVGRAAFGAAGREMGNAVMGSRMGKFIAGGSAESRIARFGFRTGMAAGYVEATTRQTVDAATTAVGVGRSAVRGRMDRMASGAADYNSADLIEYMVQNSRPTVAAATARRHGRQLASKAYQGAASAVSLTKREVDETLEGIARSADQDAAVVAARQQWTSSLADGDMMVSRLSQSQLQAIRGRMRGHIPVSRIQSLANKEVRGVALSDVAGRICGGGPCREALDETTGEHLEAFARAHVRSAGLPVGQERALLSGNRRWITYAAVGSAMAAYMMDSRLGKYTPCAGNAYCVDQPFEETRWRVELAPEAGAYWKAVRTPAIGQLRGDHHIRAWLTSPCKADIKVGRDSTYCKASEVYQPDRAWLSISSPSIRLPKYDADYQMYDRDTQVGPGQGVAEGFNFVLGTDAASIGAARTHALKYMEGACAAYTRESLEEEYLEEPGIDEGDTEFRAGSGTCTGPWENPEAETVDRSAFTCSGSVSNLCQQINNEENPEALCGSTRHCAWACAGDSTRGCADFECQVAEHAPAPTCDTLTQQGRDATIEHITAQNPEQICNAISGCSVTSGSGTFHAGTCGPDPTSGSEACGDVARTQNSAGNNGYCSAVGKATDEPVNCGDVDSFAARHNVNPYASCEAISGCQWDPDSSVSTSGGSGGQAACDAVFDSCQDIESSTMCDYSAEAQSNPSCDATQTRPDDGFCDALEESGVGESMCIDAGCTWDEPEGADDIGGTIDVEGDLAKQCADQQKAVPGTGPKCLDRAAVASCTKLPQGLAAPYASRILEHLSPLAHCSEHEAPGFDLQTAHGETGSQCGNRGRTILRFSQGCQRMAELFPDVDVDDYSAEACYQMLERSIRGGDIWVSHVQAGDYLQDPRPFISAWPIRNEEPFIQTIAEEAWARPGDASSVQFSIPASEWTGQRGADQVAAVQDKIDEMTQIVKEEAWDRCTNGEWSGDTAFRDCGDMTESEFMAQTEVAWPSPSPVNIAGDDTYMMCGASFSEDDWVPGWMGGGQDTTEEASLVLEPGAYDAANDDFSFHADKTPFENKYSDVSPNFCWENSNEEEDWWQIGTAAFDVVVAIGAGATIVLSSGTLAPAVAVGVGAVSGAGSVVAEGYWSRQDKWPD